MNQPGGGQKRGGKPRRRKPAGGGGGAAKARPDLWAQVPSPPDPEPISPSGEPAALFRSLGTAPLTGQAVTADRYVATVVERAAAVAAALAASADLLAGSGSESE